MHIKSLVPVLLVAAFSVPIHAGAQLQGQELIDSMVAALPKVTADTSRALLLSTIGFRYSMSDPALGSAYANKGLVLSQSLHWKRGMGNAYNILGICATNNSDYKKGFDFYNLAYAIFQETRDKRGLLKVLGNIGNTCVYQSDYSRALEYNFTALKYAEDLGDTVSVTINLNNIGSIYEYLGNYDKGLEYNFKALALVQLTNDSANIALTLGNIGNLYSGKREHANALKYKTQALSYHERLDDKEGIARDLLNIGGVYVDIKDYNKALEMYLRSLEVSKFVAFRLTEANALSAVGETLAGIAVDSVSENKIQKLAPGLASRYHLPSARMPMLLLAIAYLKQSIEISLAIDNLAGLQQSYLYLSAAQRAAGQYAEALNSKDRYILFKDSVFTMDSKLKVANLETKREIDLKDKQIELDRLAVAKKRNERVFFIAGFVLLLAVIGIVIRNMKLKSAKEVSENKLQTFQARMNPHFIFNSLNSIQSLVLSNDTISSITYLSRFSKLMRQILDGSAKSKVLLETELQMLRGYIELEQLRFERFSYEIDIAPDINPAAVEVPAMIIQPFVENAIIHGILPKKDAGILRIVFQRKNQVIVCTIDDNGIGRAQSAELNKGRSREHEPQGIRITESRLEMLHKKRRGGPAAVTYIDKSEGAEATGTTVILHIPML